MAMQRYLWFLDAGHAPSTPGKRSPRLDDDSRLYEWQCARDVVDRIADMLDVRGIAYHVLTPRTDFDMPASSRAELANFVAGKVTTPSRLISVHMNAHGNGSDFTDANGVTVLHYPGSATSQRLAQELQTRLVAATGMRDRGIKERDDLAILRRTSMPAVLSESGFYTNPEDLSLLLSDSGREAIARAHVAFIAGNEE